MTIFADYTILATLYESERTLVQRAIEEKTHTPVVLKILQKEYPSPEDLARYRLEYETTKNITSRHVIQAYQLIPYHNSLVIVLEDFEAVSLQNFLTQKKHSLSSLLYIALQVTKGLIDIHSAQVIHKDINTSNIVINPKTKQTKIIDFGIAECLPTDGSQLQTPTQLEGTLNYISPEQTGRTNCILDHRTDFYAWGVTLYELFSGQLPFINQDSSELVHYHLAKQPVSLEQLALPYTIPPMLSKVVNKLMEKTAEKRYQTAWGLYADLEKIQRQLSQNSWQNFTLAHMDVSDKLVIPEKLYGREQVITTLMADFERMRQTDSPALLLVAGYAGIGKSALIHTVRQQMTHSYFIRGKFEQLQRNEPYSALSQAFQDLVQQLLTESKENLVQWQDKLLNVLGKKGQVLIDIIPELELILGKQPAVPELTPVESMNRFQDVWLAALRVFCQLEHPLILFLDDLQWADMATLRLIQTVMTDTTLHHFVLIGAYRDNEVDHAHPLMITLSALRSYNIPIRTLTLTPLTHSDIVQLLKNSLDPNDIHPNKRQFQQQLFLFAELMMEKTKGNPFFVKQLLQHLHQDKLLTFSSQAMHWQWDLQQIHQKNISDNVVDFILNRLTQQPKTVQDVLSLAACLGNQFSLSALAIIYQQNLEQTYQHLQPAIQDSFIIFLSDSAIDVPNARFKFLHDRIQQAAYALIDSEQQKRLHLTIAQRLQQNLTPEEQQDKLFEIVDHLNIGHLLITEVEQQIHWMTLNFHAAQKAKQSLAYHAALQYLHTVFQFPHQTSEQLWQIHYELMYQLHIERAELEYLNGHLSQAQQIIMENVAHAHTALEKAEALHMQIVQYTLQAHYVSAIETGRQALALMNITLPDDQDNLEAARDAEIARILAFLETHSIDAMLDFPIMSDVEKQMAVKLLVTMGPPCYRSHPRLWAVIVSKVINLCINYGNVPQIGYAYTAFGGLMGYVHNRYDMTHAFGDVATKIMQQKFASDVSAQSVYYLMIGSSVRAWSQHLKIASQDYQQAYHVGLESGNLQYAAYAFGHNMYCRFYQGIPLSTLADEIGHSLAFSRSRSNQWAIDLLEGGLLIIAQLQQPLNNKVADVKHYLTGCKQHENPQVMCIYHILSSFVYYLQEHYTEALKALELAESNLITVAAQGLYPMAAYNFTHSLVLTALYPQADNQPTLWQQLEHNQTQMAIWAKACPANFNHQYTLIQAEMARLSKQGTEYIFSLYDEAIEQAKQQGFTQHVALANELAGKYWLSYGKENFATLYFKEANYHYTLWGAMAKVKGLDEHYHKLITTQKVVATQNVTQLQTTLDHYGNELDLATVLKASQAISEEIVLEQLIKKLLWTVVENAGAETGVLILDKDGGFRAVAQAHMTTAQVKLLKPPPLITENNQTLVPVSVINYVTVTKQELVLGDTSQTDMFSNDNYVKEFQPKSVCCLPMVYQQQVIGIVYLENSLTSDAFTERRVSLLRLLSTQMAISVQNALLFADNERARHASEAANRAKSAFLANMSHELRTPLNGILGYSQMLTRDTHLQNTHRKSAEAIERNGYYLLTLLNDILELSKLEAEQLELYASNFCLPKFIEDLIALFTLRAHGKKLSFTYQYLSPLPTMVCGDEKRLRQVITNLLSNAIKFTEQGGIIFKCHYEESLLHIEVQDTGIGISDAVQQHIFEPFVQINKTKLYSRGIGLGLSIVQHIVKLMQGKIHLHSEEGKGTTFKVAVKLREIEGGMLPIIEDRSIIIGYQGQSQTLLVIDDEQGTRDILRNLLVPLGFKVIEAADGLEGVNKARTYRPNLILTDLVMPIMDGFETIRQVRQQEAPLDDIPIVAMSASEFSEPGSKLEFESVFYNIPKHKLCFLSKPIDSKNLLNCLEKQLNLKWVNEQPAKEGKVVVDVQVPQHWGDIPIDAATKLWDLAMQGDINGVLEEAEMFKQQDSMVAFYNKIRQLANELRMDEIIKLVKPYMDSPS